MQPARVQVGTQLTDCPPDLLELPAKDFFKELFTWHDCKDEPVYKIKDIPLFNCEIVFQSESTYAASLANTLAAKTPRRLGGSKSLRFLKPSGKIFWTVGQTVQIAWSGAAQPPYDVRLIPVGHPGAPIPLANGLNTRSLEYTVADDIVPGRYRVKVQGKDGWNASGDFEIHAGKPDLRIKAASISDFPSGNPDKPYRVKVEAIIENAGGYQSHPFQIMVNQWPDRSGGAVRNTGRGVVLNVEPLLDRSTFSFTATLDAKRSGEHTVVIDVDSTNRVDESVERNNEFRNAHYRMKT